MDLEKHDAELYANLTLAQKEHNDKVTDLQANYKTVMATDIHTDVREEYLFAEHFNIGPGWMMQRVGNRALGVVTVLTSKILRESV